MNKKFILQNISVAFLAQGVTLALSVIQTLIVPKLLGVEQFGYWQLYIFYVSYVGFFHLGLSSGVYLTTGGQTREEMDKASIKSQMLFGVFYQTIMVIVIVFLSCFLQIGSERVFVVVMTAIYIVLQNLATFMMNELQCMNETKKSSFSTIIERLAFLVPLLVLLLLRVDSFYPYVLSYTASTLVQLGYCAWHLRDFWGAEWFGFCRAARLGWASIKIGFPMMLANVMSMLVIGVGRFFIDARWGIETFGRLSLALSLVSFFLAFVSQASMVLFPSLRQASHDEVRGFYIAARDAMGLFFPAVYALYFPMVWLLSFWLPNYSSTFTYLIYLLPICVFDSRFNITGVTYFNVLRRERVMLVVNVVAACASLLLTLISVYVIGSVYAVIVSMTFVIVARGLCVEFYMNRLLDSPGSAIGFVELLLTAEFIAMANLVPPVLAFLIYLVSYASFLFIFRGIYFRVLRKLRV